MEEQVTTWNWWLLLGLCGCCCNFQCRSTTPPVVEVPPTVQQTAKDSLPPNRLTNALTLLTDSSAVDTIPQVPRFVSVAAFAERYATGTSYETPITVYRVRLDTANIALIDGNYRSLAALAKKHPRPYWMLTNAGMFHSGGAPVGLFQQDSIQTAPLNTQNDYGNFFLKPNGVFFITKNNQAGVLETQAFLDSIATPKIPLHLATQSGPMLVIDGKIHPKFNPNSLNRYIRSGVGVTADQEVIFVLSNRAVNLHTFARLFLEKGCNNALYLDGAISSMYLRNRADQLRRFKTPYAPAP